MRKPLLTLATVCLLPGVMEGTGHTVHTDPYWTRRGSPSAPAPQMLDEAEKVIHAGKTGYG